MKLRLILAAAALLAAPGVLSATPAADGRSNSQPHPLRVVVLGSSTAAGAGAKPVEQSWVNRYRDYLSKRIPGSEVVNLAVGGYSSFHILPTGFPPSTRRPAPDVEHNITKALSLKPDVIILNLPSNDASGKFAPAESQRNFDVIAREAALARVPLWVTTTQPRNMSDDRRRTQVIMRDWLRHRFRARCLDFWTGLADEDAGLLKEMDFGDGVHINNAGHDLVLRRVIEAGIPARLNR